MMYPKRDDEPKHKGVGNLHGKSLMLPENEGRKAYPPEGAELLHQSRLTLENEQWTLNKNEWRGIYPPDKTKPLYTTRLVGNGDQSAIQWGELILKFGSSADYPDVDATHALYMNANGSERKIIPVERNGDVLKFGTSFSMEAGSYLILSREDWLKAFDGE